MKKFAKVSLFVFICLGLTAPLWVFKDLLFPFVTSKAFFFRICLELALPFYVYLLVTDPKLRPNLKNPLNLAVLAFLAINIISSFTGVNVVRSLFGNFERMGGAYYLAHLVALYFYILALGQMQGPYMQNMLRFLLFVALIVTGNGLFGWLHLPTFVEDPSLPARVSSTLGNPIYLGSFLIVPMVFSLFFARQAEKLAWAVVYYFLAALFLLGILLSGTRGALVGVLIGAFVAAVIFVVFSKRKKVRLYGSLAIGGLVLVAAVLFFSSSKFPAGSIERRIFKLNDSNSESRLLQWGIALHGFKDRPLLGTGPENYYLVGNLYYNPLIAQYDPSWFDKPHNYLLEILITNGALGFLAYAAMLVFMVWAFILAYKKGFFNLTELCFLLGGIFAYQIQNLFVFDTVPASLMFYSLAGFASYVWFLPAGEHKKIKAEGKARHHGQALAWTSLGVTSVVVLYALYATNYLPMAAAKDVNYGFAYGAVDPAKAYGYFQDLMTVPFNFDLTESAVRFSNFAVSFTRTATPDQQALSQTILDSSISYLETAIAGQSNYAISWQQMSQSYLFKGAQSGDTAWYQKAEDASKKAIALAPKREEGYLSLSQVYGVEGRLPEAQEILLEQVRAFPGDLNAKVQLVTIYRVGGRLDEAAAVMQEALDKNYSFTSYSDMQWLIKYYEGKKDWDKAIALQQLAGKVEPNNIVVFEDLANLYALAGQNQAALSLAEQIVNYATSTQAQMGPLIDRLSKIPAPTK